MVAFVSKRDGRSRIWLRSIKSGTERPLTNGPDWEPQFSPDGSSILFMRGGDTKPSAYRVPALGGQPRRVLDNAVAACWSPDGKQLAYMRWTGTIAQGSASIRITDISSGASRELVVLNGLSLYGLRWSPDGKWISGSAGNIIQNTPSNFILLVNTETGEQLRTPEVARRLSGPAWNPDSQTLIYAESTSLLGDLSGALGRAKRRRRADDAFSLSTLRAPLSPLEFRRTGRGFLFRR